MPSPIEDAIRARVIADVASGLSARAAARRRGVSVSSAIKWAQRWRASGSFAALPPPRRPRSPLQREAAFLLALVEQRPGITLAQVQLALHRRGVTAAISSVWRFYHRHGIRLRARRYQREALDA